MYNCNWYCFLTPDLFLKWLLVCSIYRTHYMEYGLANWEQELLIRMVDFFIRKFSTPNENQEMIVKKSHEISNDMLFIDSDIRNISIIFFFYNEKTLCILCIFCVSCVIFKWTFLRMTEILCILCILYSKHFIGYRWYDWFRYWVKGSSFVCIHVR